MMTIRLPVSIRLSFAPSSLTTTQHKRLPIEPVHPPSTTVLVVLESTLQFQLTDNIRTARNKIKIHATDFPPNIELILGVLVDFDDNPTLHFQLIAKFDMDGAITFAGMMKGMWLKPFGIKWLAIGNCAISVTFGTKKAIGLGGEVWIGPVKIALHGRVVFPHLHEIFLLGSVKTDEGIIKFRDLAKWWCDFVPSWLCIAPEKFNPDWGILDLSFYVSAKGGLVLGRRYPPGFAFDGGIYIIGIKARVHVSMVTMNIAGVKVPNVAFDLVLNFKECYTLIDNYLRGIVPGRLQDPSKLGPQKWYKVLLLHAFNFATSFFKLNELAILDFNFASQAKGVPITLRIDFEFWGIQTVIEVKLSLWEIAGAVADKIKSALKTLKKTVRFGEILFWGD